MPVANSIAWFEIGTGDPTGAEQFYGDVFGWTVAHDDTPYQFFSTGGGDGLPGGLFATKGELPDYAIFTVLVEDVEATCRKTEAAGGKVQRPPQVNPAGVRFAYLLDPAGNLFGVFTPGSAA